jgi:AcrR family transcriptional regulator
VSTTDRPLRRDAERNRQRLLEAARELFAERGLAVTLDDIAHRAGVGVGTAYRRFGSREALVDALFEERLNEMLELIEGALAIADPWEALAGFLERMAEVQAADRGLKEVMLGSTEGRDRVRRVREQMVPRAVELVRRAQAAGLVRADFDPSDLPLAQIMVGAIADVSPPERPDLWRRFLALLLDGMRPAGAARPPLAEPPLGVETIDDVMCRWRPPRRLR